MYINFTANGFLSKASKLSSGSYLHLSDMHKGMEEIT